MKTTSKILLALMVVATLAVGACSRTKDAAGLDWMYNAVKANNWNSVVKQIGTDISAKVELVPEGGFAKFFENKVQIFDKNENPTGVSMTYGFKDTRTMTIDGVDYRIQENFIASMKTMTAVSGDGLTTYIFKR